MWLLISLTTSWDISYIGDIQGQQENFEFYSNFFLLQCLMS